MGNSSKKVYSQLIHLAREARLSAYAPYSRFRVGAALLTAEGKVFTGCNIENSSYSLTMCAERTAIFKAVSEGEHSFRAIAIVSDDKDITPPCGACRQVLIDLCGNVDVIMTTSKNVLKVVKLNSLLPLAFTPETLHRIQRSR